MMARQATLVSMVLAAFAMGPVAAMAAPFTADYVFGDSLSDRGNLAEAIGNNFPDPPFSNNSFTNGPTAVQVMARRLGLSADPSLFVTGFQDANGLGIRPGGTNYAVAGATAGATRDQGVPGANLAAQIGAYLAQAGGAASATALYTVFIGGNDVRTAAQRGDTSFVTDGVTSELAGINTLLAAGARSLLVVNVPDVGLIPEFTLGRPTQVQAASEDSRLYNQLLRAGVASISAANGDARITQFDLYTFNNTFLANAAAAGLSDTTTPCYLNTGALLRSPSTPVQTSAACGPIDPRTGQAANVGSFQYWDAIHPTAVVHAAFGNALYDAEVPEPASLVLLTSGLALAVAVSRARAS